MSERKDILIGIDAGTSVIKAVAFDLGGRQIAVASALACALFRFATASLACAR